MKNQILKRKSMLLLLSFLLIGGAYFPVNHLLNKYPDLKFWKEEKGEEEGEEEEEGKEAGVEKQMLMWWTARAFPDATNINGKYQQAWARAVQLRQEYQPTTDVDRVGGVTNTEVYHGQWTSLGPSTNIGGRILAICVNPLRSNSVYAGSASGGIWKSDDGAATWHSVVTNLPVLSVTSIIINPADTMQIYVGTGEVYRYDSGGTVTQLDTANTGFNVWKMRGTYGVGVLKSTNGGVSWSQVMVKSESNLFGIQRLRFNPGNYNTIFACATDGLYRSRNGGLSWTQILAKTYVSDVVINVRDTNQIVVGVGNLQNTDKGVYRTINGGTNWSKIASALPASFQGSIRLDNRPVVGQRDTIIASIGVSETSTSELYRTTDFGATWTALSNSGHTQWQYWCAHALAIDPANSNHILYAGVSMYGYTLPSSHPGISIGHSDIHDIAYDPSNANTVYVACDGGIYKSTSGGGSLTAVNNGLAAVQFYSTVGVGTSATSAALIVGGLQDNGVIKYNGSTGTWSGFSGLTGTDGASCFIDPTNDANILASGDARQVNLSTNTGASATNVLDYWGAVHDSRTAFVAPMAISKSSHLTMYVATDEWNKSTTGGGSGSWTNNVGGAPGTNYIDALHKTAIALSISKTNANKVYVSTSPFSQFDNDADNMFYNPPPNVLKTTTGGPPFTKINGTGANKLPNRYVMRFAVSPTFDDSVWVAVGGYGTPHVYVTPDGGTNWYSRDPGAAASGLPDVPANAIMIDPANSNIIYVGNDLGVYMSNDRGNHWRDYNVGLWDATMVMDLEPYPGGKILAATHGKGIFISPLISGVLPVTLTGFTGINKGNYNELDWTTSAETNFSHYELERSTDGINFINIQNVTANGGFGNQKYSYNDYLSSQPSPQYFYRLKIVDIDGEFTYSNIVAISVATGIQVKISGTLSNGLLNLQVVSDISQPAIVNLYDAGGRQIARRLLTVNRGSNTFVLDELMRMPHGLYLVETVIRNKSYNNKVLRQ